MTSEPTHCFVWIWLPDATDPVVCGRLDHRDGVISFTYARSYLARAGAVPIYAPELPLRPGPQFATSGDRLPLCIDDAMPDSWGRRVVEHRLGTPGAEYDELTYLLASGSDRIGALDFQHSASEYVARDAPPPALDDLAVAADRLEAGQAIDHQLADVLLHATSIGGARPKALLVDGDRRLIAKFTSTLDRRPVVQGEFVAMELARRCGIDAAAVAVTAAAGRHALLVERFDRSTDGGRRRLVSALTVLGETTFPGGRYATYVRLADALRAQSTRPDVDLRELFGRIAFNILCSNTDDHGRNHAVFVDRAGISLTPAYDICPQARSGDTAFQAMAFGPDGEREARVDLLIKSSAVYHLDHSAAREIVDYQVDTISAGWDEVCDLAHLTVAEAGALRGTQFLHPSGFR